MCGVPKTQHIFTAISVVFAHFLPPAWGSFPFILVVFIWVVPRNPSEQHGRPWPCETSFFGRRAWVKFPVSMHSAWPVLTQVLSAHHSNCLITSQCPSTHPLGVSIFRGRTSPGIRNSKKTLLNELTNLTLSGNFGKTIKHILGKSQLYWNLHVICMGPYDPPPLPPSRNNPISP